MELPIPKESTFTSDKIGLSNLLASIHTGSIQLPDFQRGWVWDDEHIRDLIESISLSYPMGTIMLLEMGGKTTHFKPRAIDGAPEPKDEPEQLILDGQQRLTSLYQAIFSNGVVNTRDSRKKPIKRWYYIDMRKSLSSNGDRSDAIISLAEDRTVRNFRGEVQEDYSSSEKEYQHCLFPLNRVFNSSAWRHGFNEYWDHSSEKVRLFDQFESEVIDRFKGYLVPVIFVKKNTPKEAVCQVFEKVNTGGVSLTVFELLTASFDALNYSLRDDWEIRAGRLKKNRLLAAVQNTDFLQAIALLVTYTKQLDAIHRDENEENIPGISCKRKDILRLTVDDYQNWANKVEKGFGDAARFLYRQHFFDQRDLPYRTQLVPLAAIFTWLGSAAETDSAQSKLAQWFWCGILGELYGSSVESRFARDLPEVSTWIRTNQSLPKTIEDANFSPSRLYTLRTRNSAAYKGIHALLMRQGCLDLRTGVTMQEQAYFEDSVDIHHIFPYDWCEKNSIPTGQRDCIINKTPISARSNRMIGGNAPSVYLEAIQKNAEISATRMDEILRSHLIAPAFLREDNFSAFFTQRETSLLDIIEKAMGKSMMREAASQPIDMEDYEGKDAEETFA